MYKTAKENLIEGNIISQINTSDSNAILKFANQVGEKPMNFVGYIDVKYERMIRKKEKAEKMKLILQSLPKRILRSQDTRLKQDINNGSIQESQYNLKEQELMTVCQKEHSLAHVTQQTLFEENCPQTSENINYSEVEIQSLVKESEVDQQLNEVQREDFHLFQQIDCSDIQLINSYSTRFSFSSEFNFQFENSTVLNQITDNFNQITTVQCDNLYGSTIQVENEYLIQEEINRTKLLQEGITLRQGEESPITPTINDNQTIFAEPLFLKTQPNSEQENDEGHSYNQINQVTIKSQMSLDTTKVMKTNETDKNKQDYSEKLQANSNVIKNIMTSFQRFILLLFRNSSQTTSPFKQISEAKILKCKSSNIRDYFDRRLEGNCLPIESTQTQIIQLYNKETCGRQSVDKRLFVKKYAKTFRNKRCNASTFHQLQYASSYSTIFQYYLENFALNWLVNSKIQNKNSHFLFIKSFINQQQNLNDTY